jgi:hypothetical protein
MDLEVIGSEGVVWIRQDQDRAIVHTVMILPVHKR